MLLVSSLKPLLSFPINFRTELDNNVGLFVSVYVPGTNLGVPSGNRGPRSLCQSGSRICMSCGWYLFSGAMREVPYVSTYSTSRTEDRQTSDQSLDISVLVIRTCRTRIQVYLL